MFLWGLSVQAPAGMSAGGGPAELDFGQLAEVEMIGRCALCVRLSALCRVCSSVCGWFQVSAVPGTNDPRETQTRFLCELLFFLPWSSTPPVRTCSVGAPLFLGLGPSPLLPLPNPIWAALVGPPLVFSGRSGTWPKWNLANGLSGTWPK